MISFPDLLTYGFILGASIWLLSYMALAIGHGIYDELFRYFEQSRRDG